MMNAGSIGYNMSLNQLVNIKTEPLDDIEIDELPSFNEVEPESSRVFKGEKLSSTEIVRVSADVDEMVKEEPLFDGEPIDSLEIQNKTKKKKVSKVSSGSERRKHELKAQKYQCYLCGYSTKSKHNLKSFHFIRRHVGGDAFKCGHCGNKFPSKSLLTDHQRIHVKNFSCQYCERKFTKTWYLDRHHGQCLPLLLNANMNRLFQMNGSFECYTCKMTSFENFGQLKIHNARNHSGQTIFNCNICQQKFNVRERLVSHLKFHTNKRFKCDKCPKMFTKKRNLKRHCRLHTSVGLFECKYCGKQMTQKYGLQVHERLHTGEKPFSCAFLCGLSFARKDTLDRHHKSKHGN